MKRPSKLFPYLFSVGLLAGSAFIASCSKDDDPAPVRPEVEIPTQFSELSAEQNKAQLEQNGLQMVSNLNALKDTDGIEASISFNHFLSVAALPENGRLATSNKAVKMLMLLGKFGAGDAKASDVMKSARTTEETEPSTPQEYFDDLKGTYTYSAANATWTYTEGGDQIVFKFPATKEGTENNAQFAIYGLTTKHVVNTAAEYEGDVPTALKADLTVNGQKKMEYSFSAAYKDNGEPTSVNTSLTLDAFKFSFDAKNTTSEVGVNYSLTKSGTNLISFGAGAAGNFGSDNINNSENGGDVVTSASAYFQIMNIRFAGKADIKSMADAMETAEDIHAEAAAFDANTTFVVFYADSKQKIADTEFYGTNEEEEYSYCWDSNGDGIDDECSTWVDTHESIEVRLVFSDGSKSDLETYFDIGFEELEAELTALEEEFEEDLG